MWWFTGGGLGGGSAVILSQQTGCREGRGKRGGVSLDTENGKGGVCADTRLPLNY